jgi:hypothetical protein
MTCAVSLARTRRFVTAGAVSVHHVQPSFFFGFEDVGHGGRLATPEKALVDFLYSGIAGGWTDAAREVPAGVIS